MSSTTPPQPCRCSELGHTAIIGDIHGDIDRLNSMLNDPGLAKRDLVFLGDYINRGPASRAVVDRLIETKTARPRTCLLRGNHDEAFLDVLRGRSVAPLLLMGGSATVRSWVPKVVGDVGRALRDEVSDEELEFFEGLVDHWWADGVLAMHSRPSGQPRVPSAELLVVGHYVQRDAIPKIVDDCAYVDTGCGTLPHGRLSALLLPEREFVSH